LSTERTQTDAAEAELLSAVARGDERAFAVIYDRYSSILFGLLLRIVRDRPEAEDVLQDVFLQIWQQAVNFDPARGRAFTWLVTLARSRAIDRLRSRDARERTANAAAQEAVEEVGDALSDAVRAEQSEVVRGALAAIPEEQRRALMLAYFEGLSQTEIAERTGQPLGTVKTRMRAGLHKLRELLRRRVEEPLTGL
jgi:RNA polymerase sigma-70 factor (ECF subfamily)